MEINDLSHGATSECAWAANIQRPMKYHIVQNSGGENFGSHSLHFTHYSRLNDVRLFNGIFAAAVY